MKRRGKTKKQRTKQKRKLRTRRNKVKSCKVRGGDYIDPIVDTYLDTPVLDEKSEKLSVTIPGFGIMGLKAFKQYEEDRDRNGYRSG